MSVKVQIGDLFESSAQTLVNTVNCVGIMGKGIAQEFQKRFPEMFKDYRDRCARNEIELGRPYIFKSLYDKAIINFPTKNHWRSVSRIEDIISGLKYFKQKYKDWGVKSVAFPPLGCGNGGLEWDIVGPLMVQELSQLDIPVEIYAPYGTPQQKLSMAFLSAKSTVNSRVHGIRNEKLKPEWLVLVEILYNLQKQPYVSPVGRTTFQKICYIATEMKLDTGFIFNRSSYGPFSKQIKLTLSVLANYNLIFEKQMGKMTAIKTGSEYEKFRNEYKFVLSEHHKLIEKITDLFVRIKNTAQAEEVSTVLYATKKLKEENKTQKISEREIFDYVLRWKKSWDTDQKKQEVATTIRDLGMMQWIKTDFSENIPVEATV